MISYNGLFWVILYSILRVEYLCYVDDITGYIMENIVTKIFLDKNIKNQSLEIVAHSISISKKQRKTKSPSLLACGNYYLCKRQWPCQK